MRLFVFTSRTAFVVAADEAMIEYAVRKHFPDLPDTTGPQTYARNYLEKLIQVPFRIPALGDTETRIYVTLLLVGAELGDNDPAFNTLIGVARERLKRPWTSGALDAASVRTALGDKASRANNALALSDQIGPILTSGTKGNPRQIKRFLNTLVLRQRTAEARGFGDDVKLPVLAKLMLAERFIPRLFDQIAAAAAAAPDGKCPDLAALEAAATAKEETKRAAKADKAPSGGKSGDTAKAAPKLEAVKATESALLSEWLSSPAIKAWAAVPTAIGDEDLRPYLFVAKDRKDYFGAASVLGHLAAVVEQLFGGKFAVQGLEPDLKRLAPPEAAQVFEAVRGRIVGGDSFDTEPPGTAGLAILVKAHPTLQGNLVDFLDALPRDRLGPWVCSGWEGVLKDPDAAQRFDRLLQAWGKDGGAMLKAAATGVAPYAAGISLMGTSSAFGGQGGGTPLVPSWLGDDGAPPAAPDGVPPDRTPPDAPADGTNPPGAPPAPPARPPIPPIADPTRFSAARNNFSRFARLRRRRPQKPRPGRVALCRLILGRRTHRRGQNGICAGRRQSPPRFPVGRGRTRRD